MKEKKKNEIVVLEARSLSSPKMEGSEEEKTVKNVTVHIHPPTNPPIPPSPPTHNNATESKQWSPKVKGVPTYLFINPASKEIVCALILEDGAQLSSKTVSKIASALLESGYNVQQGTSLEASALLEVKVVHEQKELF